MGPDAGAPPTGAPVPGAPPGGAPGARPPAGPARRPAGGRVPRVVWQLGWASPLNDVTSEAICLLLSVFLLQLGVALPYPGLVEGAPMRCPRSPSRCGPGTSWRRSASSPAGSCGILEGRAPPHAGD